MRFIATLFHAVSLACAGVLGLARPAIATSPEVRPTALPQRVKQGGGTWSSRPVAVSNVSTLVVPFVATQRQKRRRRDCPGTNSSTPPDHSRLLTTLFKEHAPRKAHTTGGTFDLCSYGLTKFDTNNSVVVDPPVNIACSGTTQGLAWNVSTCTMQDIIGWGQTARAEVERRGVDLARFRYIAFLVPHIPACSFTAFASVGCAEGDLCSAYFNWPRWEVPQMYNHELGHLMGLHHAGMGVGTDFNEYADETCTMGYCCNQRCWNAPHAWHLGWIEVREFNGTTMEPGIAYNVTIPTQSRPVRARRGRPVRTGVRVVTTWSDGASVWISYRTRAGGDREIFDGFWDRVHVHTGEQHTTTLEASLNVNDTWTIANVTIHRGESTKKGVAVVTLTRAT